VNDGLQSNEFNGGAFHKGKSGKMYFGGVYGLNILDPQKIKPVDFKFQNPDQENQVSTDVKKNLKYQISFNNLYQLLLYHDSTFERFESKQ
jgi:hypothetical protein